MGREFGKYFGRLRLRLTFKVATVIVLEELSVNISLFYPNKLFNLESEKVDVSEAKNLSNN